MRGRLWCRRGLGRGRRRGRFRWGHLLRLRRRQLVLGQLPRHSRLDLLGLLFRRRRRVVVMVLHPRRQLRRIGGQLRLCRLGRLVGRSARVGVPPPEHSGDSLGRSMRLQSGHARRRRVVGQHHDLSEHVRQGFGQPLHRLGPFREQQARRGRVGHFEQPGDHSGPVQRVVRVVPADLRRPRQRPRPLVAADDQQEPAHNAGSFSATAIVSGGATACACRSAARSLRSVGFVENSRSTSGGNGATASIEHRPCRSLW